MEKWSDVVGFEAFYEVSDKGRVRSKERKYADKNSVVRKVRSKVLRPCSSDGYLRVVLIVNGKRNYKTVHSLVCRAFLGEKPAGLVIRHLDGDRTNNCLDNLAYGTHKQNINEREPFSESVSPLSESDVTEIIEMRNVGHSVVSISKRFNVSPTTVSNVYNGKTWGHVKVDRERSRNGKKLTDAQVVEIREMRARGDKLVDIAQKFGLKAHNSVSRIAAHLNYSNVEGGPLTPIARKVKK